MVSKKHRFHGLNALNHVYRRGKGARENGLTLKSLPNRREDYRLAVVVSKKVHKSAVARNRIRRRLYESVRQIKQNSPEAWQYDMILSCFDKDLADYPATKIRKRVESLLSQAGIHGKL